MESGGTMMNQLMKLLANDLIKSGRKVSPTFLMWQMMNELTDQELYELDLTITDIAEEVLKFCENCKN